MAVVMVAGVSGWKAETLECWGMGVEAYLRYNSTKVVLNLYRILNDKSCMDTCKCMDTYTYMTYMDIYIHYIRVNVRKCMVVLYALFHI